MDNLDSNSHSSPRPIAELIDEISQLPADFHGAGVLSGKVVQAIRRHCRDMEVNASVETGSGKSTLLFSWLSRHHQVFTLGPPHDAGSLGNVLNNPLFNAGNVEFILGPSQQTLPAHSFTDPLQLAFIDGPHGFPFPQLEYYYLYPHLEENALFILDDVHIPTIAQMEHFLREDEMFEYLETVDTTAFFRRTSAPLFNAEGDGWWQQNYNKNRFARLEAEYYGQTRPVSTQVYDRLSALFGKDFAERMRKSYRRLVPRRDD